MTSPQVQTLSKLDTILNNRGILQSAKTAGWQAYTRKGYDGWSMPLIDPLTGDIVGHWWKNADSTSKFKYMPLGDSLTGHTGEQWYISNPFKTRSAIHHADGVVYIANGAPSLLAYNEAGIHNVIASRLEGSIPSNALEVFNAYGITRAHYVFDNDHAGLTASIAWRDVLQDSTIDYTAYTWGNDKPTKYDANDAWLDSGFDSPRFRTTLYTIINTQSVTLPLPEKPRLMQADFTGTNETRGKLIKSLETALLGQGFISNNKGWINGRCILHDDKHASAGMDVNTGVYVCRVCGSFSPEAIATELNIPLPEKEAIVHKDACEVGLYNTLREKLNTSKITKVAIILEAYHMNNNADTGVLLTIDEFIERMGKYGKQMSYSSVYTALNTTIRGYLGRVFTFSKKEDDNATDYGIFTQEGVFFDFFTLLIEYSKEGSKSKNTTKPKKRYYIPSQSELADLLGIQLKDRSPISVRCLKGVKQYRQESLVKVYKSIESTDISNKQIGAFVGVGRATASRYIDEHKNLHKKHNPPAIIRTIKRSNPILPKHKGRMQWLQVQGSDHMYPYTQEQIDRIFASPRNHEVIEVYAPSCNTVSYVPDDSPVVIEFEQLLSQQKDIAS